MQSDWAKNVANYLFSKSSVYCIKLIDVHHVKVGLLNSVQPVTVLEAFTLQIVVSGKWIN